MGRHGDSPPKCLAKACASSGLERKASAVRIEDWSEPSGASFSNWNHHYDWLFKCNHRNEPTHRHRAFTRARFRVAKLAA
jgi:hypothetical protein